MKNVERTSLYNFVVEKNLEFRTKIERKVNMKMIKTEELTETHVSVKSLKFQSFINIKIMGTS